MSDTPSRSTSSATVTLPERFTASKMSPRRSSANIFCFSATLINYHTASFN